MKLSTLGTLLLPLMGLLTTILMGFFKKISSWVDAQAPLVKQVIVAVISAAVFFAAKYIGAAVPDDPTTWTDGTVVTFITSLLAFGFKAIKDAFMKSKTPL